MSVRSRRGRARGRGLALLASAALLLSATPGGWAPVAEAATEAKIARSADGVALREDPTYGAAVLGVLADGTPVELRIDRFDTVYDPDGQTRWWPVETALGEGWVAGFFLDTGGLAGEAEAAGAAVTATDPARPAAVGGEDQLVGGEVARVDDPDGVNLRAEPTAASEALRSVRYGDLVDLRIDVLDTVYAEGTRWWPVGIDGAEGWVSGDYLAPADAGTEPAPEAADGSEPAAVNAEAISAFVANAYVQVLTDDGGGLNMRADPAPDAERIGSIPESDVVQVMDGPGYDPIGNPWYLVTDGETTGWVIGTYLAGADQPAAADGPEPPAVPAIPDPSEEDSAVFAVDAFVEVLTDDGAGLNMRADPARDAKRVGSIPDNELVQIADGPVADDAGDPWYLVTNGETTGWVTGAYLVGAAAPTAEDDEASAPPANVPGIATGAFQYPLERFTFTQGFGCSPYWFEPWSSNLGCNYHNGIDLAQDAYTPLLAADGGVVEQAGWCDCGLGYYVKIDHGNGFKTTYGHMAEMPYVSPGQALAKGDPIGPVGSTGNSTGPHVHFIVQADGVDVDPLGFLP